METFPQALPLGTTLGSFELRAVLGQGGGGFAYLCYDSLLEREVVLKEHFPAGLCRRTPAGVVVALVGAEDAFEQSLNLFLQEARTLAALRHAGVARILDVIDSHGTAVAVMEPVAGERLDAFLTCHAEDPAVITRLLRQLLCILSFLHEHCIIHRDIKPANIVVRADGSPVLLDFGAALRGETAGLRTIIGTPGFAAPEQFDAHGTPGPWSDLYALGMSFMQVLGAERVSKLPRRLRRSLYRATRQDAARRFRRAEDWLRALRPSHLPWMIASAICIAILTLTLCTTQEPENSPAPKAESAQPGRLIVQDTDEAARRWQAINERFSGTSSFAAPDTIEGFRLTINPQRLTVALVDAELRDWQRLNEEELAQRLSDCVAKGDYDDRKRIVAPPAPPTHLDFPTAGQDEGHVQRPAYTLLPDKQSALLTLPRGENGKEVFLLRFFSPQSGYMSTIRDEGTHALISIPFTLTPLSDLSPQAEDKP